MRYRIKKIKYESGDIRYKVQWRYLWLWFDNKVHTGLGLGLGMSYRVKYHETQIEAEQEIEREVSRRKRWKEKSTEVISIKDKGIV